jgi:disulfide bond formation protein DsbB
LAERHATQHLQSPLSYGLNLLALVGICIALLMAFYFQLVLGEIPCPLCQLQRVALVLVGFGFALNLRFGASATHYAIVILSAVVGAGISMRQDLLHIAPSDPGFGSPFLGLHLYTWGFIAFVASVVFTALMLMLDRDHLATKRILISTTLGTVVLALFLLLGVANLASTTMVCNFGPCPADPTDYALKWW